MLVVMEPTANESEIARIVIRLTDAGCHVSRMGMDQVVLGVEGSPRAGAEDALDAEALLALPGVADVTVGGEEYRLAGERVAKERALVELGRGLTIGGERLVVMAGPCSIEDEESLYAIAAGVADAGAGVLRAGAYKPRTSPYRFQGLGEEGLYLLRKAADAYGLLTVSEVMELDQIPLAAHYCDILQVGARNMYNYPLLRELGRCHRPVLLKRGLSATIGEWLSAAEYIMACGNRKVLLCERGIRTYEPATRNTLDLSAVPAVRARSQLPILADPSHGTGRRDHVLPMARAAIAAGADGLLVEAHVEPDRAVSDAAQTISTEALGQLVQQVHRIAEALDRWVFADSG